MDPLFPAPEPKPLVPSPASPRQALKPFAFTLKLCGIGALVLVLLIPLFMIRGLLEERHDRCAEAVREITSTWGSSQNLAGPILVVPYRALRTVEKESVVNGRTVRTTEERMGDAFACFLPEDISIEGSVTPSIRYRGIYEAVVYTTHLRLVGRFGALNLKPLGVSAEALQWNRAWLAFGISDLRGARDTLNVLWDGKPLKLTPGSQLEGVSTGLHADLIDTANAATAATSGHDFSLEIELNGSASLSFSPLAAQTSVKLESPWPDPSFTGGFLPAERTISSSGFSALWKIPYYGRDCPQQWACLADQPSFEYEPHQGSSFGVELARPVDSYRAVERATKHGALFITLLFTAFFLFEVLSALRLHVFHYLLVGAALCLFYLGLLSLAEFISFGLAYLASAAASTLLIGLYCRSILKSGARSFLITALLGGIYAFLYFVLQMQDYALLAGTVALFAVLGTVMYATRKVEWSTKTTTNS